LEVGTVGVVEAGAWALLSLRVWRSLARSGCADYWRFAKSELRRFHPLFNQNLQP